MTDEIVEIGARAIFNADAGSSPWWETEPDESRREQYRIEFRSAITALRSAGYAIVPVDAIRDLKTTLVNGTVYEDGEPSYHNGPIDELFAAVDRVAAAQED